jgi:hypothetical protein
MPKMTVFLQQIIQKFFAGWCNGNTPDSGSGYSRFES